MEQLIKINNKYGAKVGSIKVFTKQGAVEAFKKFQILCNTNATMESIYVMQQVEEDMIKLGFTYRDLEKLDIEYWQIDKENKKNE